MRIPLKLPSAFSTRTPQSLGTTTGTRGAADIDIMVGATGLRLATNPQIPASIQTVQRQKEQRDTEPLPGEQSLAAWWRRAQHSWHGGAGYAYAETDQQTTTTTTFFDDSHGVDPWTKGQLSLLPAMARNDTAGPGWAHVRPGSKVALIGPSTGFAILDDPSAAPTLLHQPASEDYLDGFVAEDYFYGLTSGGLYYGTVASPGTATKWTFANAPSRIQWAKSRLWAYGGNHIIVPDLSQPAGTSFADTFTNPNGGWTYTAMVEGPAAVYFGGHDGLHSTIEAIGLDSSGGIPTLTGAQVSAQLPDGELVQALGILAGQYVGIGTSEGFRVGMIQSDTIVYGPLLWRRFGTDDRCTFVTTWDRFFYVGYFATADTDTYRVDTSNPAQDGTFPWARDVFIGPNQSVADGAIFYGAPMLVEDLGEGTGYVWYQDDTVVPTGWLRSSLIRFSTTEPKLFKFLDLRFAPLVGSITATASSDNGAVFNVGEVATAGTTSRSAFNLNADRGAVIGMAVTFTLTALADASAGPVLTGYLVRALPSVAPQRDYILPCLLYDRETARSGRKYGYEGYAAARLADLQAIEDTGDVVTFQDFTDHPASGQMVTIEDLTLHLEQPSLSEGILVLTLRTLGGA